MFIIVCIINQYRYIIIVIIVMIIVPVPPKNLSLL